MAAEILADMTDEFVLSRIRVKYLKEKGSGAVKNDTMLEFTEWMVRSPKVNDMRNGVILLRKLVSENPKDTVILRRCYYDLAIGHARLKEFPESFHAINNLRQIIGCGDLTLLNELEEAVERKRKLEAIKEGVAAASILTVVGTAATFAFKLLRKV